MAEKPLDLHFFFKYEQGASAFLATLLEGSKQVRDEFFDMLAGDIGQEVADSFKAKLWEVRVEEYQVDIRLDAKDESWVILVENKIQAGSKQSGQLLGYYSKQIQRKPCARVVAVYLAPGGIGESEVQEVKSSDTFRRRALDERRCDFAVQVSWDEVLDNLSQIDTDEFIVNSVKEIKETIGRARQEKYPNEGERKRIHDVACQVRDGLERRFPTIRMSSPWPAKDRFTLGSQGTNLTLWLILAFDVKPNPPYAPVRLFEGDNMCLTVHSMLKLSAEGSRKRELKSRWDELRHGATLDVPQVGIHKLEDKWFVLQRELVVTPDGMVNELTNIGVSLLQVVKGWGTRG